jgi:branched-chain amino acid transport system permease protein
MTTVDQVAPPVSGVLQRVVWWHPVVVLAIAVFPFVASPKWLLVGVQVGVAIIAAMGLNLLVGYTGQISIGQGGFLAVGAYSSGYFITRSGLPTVVAIVLAVLIATGIGVFVGLPALRLRGLYLAISTLAAQSIIIWTVRNWSWLTDGTGSFVVPSPVVFGFAFDSDFRWYWLIQAICGLSMLAMRNLIESNFGRAFVAIRDAEVAGSVVGVNVTRYKLLSFAISSAYVGLAGALIGSWREVVTWERFTVDVSVLYLAMIIVGGLGTLRGSVLGAVAMSALPVVIDDLAVSLRDDVPFLVNKLPSIQTLIFGLIIVVFLVRVPGGIADLKLPRPGRLASD